MSETNVKYTDSKSDIWNAYKAQKVLLDQAGAVAPKTTVEVAEVKKIEKAVTTASTIKVDSISDTVNQLLSSIASATEKYEDIEIAIKAKQAELKDILGLEAEANSLVAIVATKDQLVADKTAEAVEIVNTAREQAANIVDSARDEKTLVNTEIAATKAATLKERARDKEEYDYNFARTKKANEDNLKDSLDAKVKVIVEREEVVTEREDLADDKDAEIDELTNQIEVLNITIDEKIEKAVSKAKDGAATSANIAKSMDRRSHEAEMTIKDARIQTLEEKVSELVSQLTVANKSVLDAQDKVTAIATNALDNQKNTDQVTRIAELNATGNKK